MKLGSLTKSKTLAHSTKGAGGKGMVPSGNSAGKPGFKSKTKAAKDPTN